MQVEVRLYGSLRQYCRQLDGVLPEVAVTDGATVRNLLTVLAIPPEQVRMIFVDGRKTDMEQPLSPGARIGLFPPDLCLLYRWYFPG